MYIHRFVIKTEHFQNTLDIKTFVKFQKMLSPMPMLTLELKKIGAMAINNLKIFVSFMRNKQEYLVTRKEKIAL